MNWQIAAILIAALSFIGTGWAVSWKFGLTFGEMKARDDELKSGLCKVEITASKLTDALAEIPHLRADVEQLKDIAKHHTSDIRVLHEKVGTVAGEVRGHLGSVSNLGGAEE